MPPRERDCIAVFSTALGWIAVNGSENVVRGVAFGHSSSEWAFRDLQCRADSELFKSDWNPSLRKRLIEFADGKPDDFLDVAVFLPATAGFALSVVERCRRIAYGCTLSYSELAAECGSPRAARAVGNVMRTNRCPLIIPCHRVVHADGSIGHFSAPQGASMKERLLAMERASNGLSAASGKTGRKTRQLA